MQQKSWSERDGDKDEGTRSTDPVLFIAIAALQSGGNGEPEERRTAVAADQGRTTQSDRVRKHKRAQEAGRENERAKGEEPMRRSSKGKTSEWRRRVEKRAHAQTGGGRGTSVDGRGHRDRRANRNATPKPKLEGTNGEPEGGTVRRSNGGEERVTGMYIRLQSVRV